MQNQGNPKQITTGTMEATRTRGKPRKRWMDAVEGYLNVIGIINKQAMVSDCWE